jgi:hypothetical protein
MEGRIDIPQQTHLDDHKLLHRACAATHLMLIISRMSTDSQRPVGVSRALMNGEVHTGD